MKMCLYIYINRYMDKWIYRYAYIRIYHYICMCIYMYTFPYTHVYLVFNQSICLIFSESGSFQAEIGKPGIHNPGPGQVFKLRFVQSRTQKHDVTMWRNRDICTKFQENRHIFGSTKKNFLGTWQRHIETGMWCDVTKMWRHIISSPSLTQNKVQVLGKFRLGTTHNLSICLSFNLFIYLYPSTICILCMHILSMPLLHVNTTRHYVLKRSMQRQFRAKFLFWCFKKSPRYVHMYTHTYIYTYTYVNWRTFSYMYTCVHAYLCTHGPMCMCMYTSIYIYMYVYVYMYMYLPRYIYIYM